MYREREPKLRSSGVELARVVTRVVTEEVRKGAVRLSGGAVRLSRQVAAKGYESALLRVYTSEYPVLLEDTRRGVTVVSVSIPFFLDGKKKRAVRSSRVFGAFPHYPNIKLLFVDSHKSKGDEVLAVVVGGEARNALGSDNPAAWLVWPLYRPGKYPEEEEKVVVGGGGKPMEKNTAEMTAFDVAMLLAQRVEKASGERIAVGLEDLMKALDLIFSRANKAWKERWKVLNERLKFTRFLMENPELVAGVLSTMVVFPPEEFKMFLEDLRGGKIKNWSDYLSRLDQVPNLRVTGGAGALAALLYPALVMHTDPENFRKWVEDVPPSIFAGYLGISFINKILEGITGKIQPQILRIAELSLAQLDEATGFFRDYKEVQVRAWRDARRELNKESRRQLPEEVNKVIKHLWGDFGQLLLPLTKTGAPPLTSSGDNSEK